MRLFAAALCALFATSLPSSAKVPPPATLASYSSRVVALIRELRPNPDLLGVQTFLDGVPKIDPNSSLEDQAKKLSAYIFETHGLKPDTSFLSRNQQDNLLPDSVLKQKQGHCVGLTALFIMAAEKARLSARLVRGPDHVFPRLCKGTRCVNVEMLKSGAILDDAYYSENLRISEEAIKHGAYLVSLTNPMELESSIYLGLGFVAAKANQFDIAELLYKRSAENSKNFAEPHSNLAAIYSMSGRKELAVKALKLGLALNPYHYATLVNLGAYHQNRGEHTEAVRFYDRAVKANDLSVEAYRKRAGLLEKQAELTAALVDLKRVLIIEPNFCDVLKDKQRIERQIGHSNDPLDSTRLSRLESTKNCRFLPN